MKTDARSAFGKDFLSLVHTTPPPFQLLGLSKFVSFCHTFMSAKAAPDKQKIEGVGIVQLTLMKAYCKL